MRSLYTQALLLLLLVAPVTGMADTPQPTTEDLPYGTGYEARHRRGQGGEQAAQDQARAREETQSAARERDRTESRASAADARPARDTTDRSQATRESRREARGHWGQHGPVRR
jgi:hypothetical protein